jgi:hypothetical protein
VVGGVRLTVMVARRPGLAAGGDTAAVKRLAMSRSYCSTLGCRCVKVAV